MDANQREIKRTPVDCPDPTTLPALVQPTPKAGKCDPPAPAVPEVFVTPSAQPSVVALPSYSVPVLNVGNAAQTAHCAAREGTPTGDDYTVEIGAIVETVALQDVPNLTEHQGRFLAALEGIQDFIGYTEEQLGTEGRLQPSQAQWLYEAIHASITGAQAVADAKALLLADSFLNCFWNNAIQSISCAVAFDTTDAMAGAHNPSVVEAGAVQSAISQADADALALTAATQALVCVWTNEDRTRNCTDLGFTSTPHVPDTGDNALDVVAAPAPAPPASTDPQRGSVTIRAGLVFSSEGQTDANALADALADSLLNCYYTNTEVSLDCVTSEVITSADKMELAHFAPDDPPDKPSGNPSGYPVVVSAGAMVSFTSQADATLQARELAITLLNCFWVNALKNADCSEYPQKIGDVDYPASEAGSPVYAASIPLNTLLSRVSQLDADTQATELAHGMLDCRYCNAAVPAHCRGDGSSDPVTPGTIIGTDWSRDFTFGVAAGVYCADSAVTAQAIAESLGTIPVRISSSATGDLCTWGNRRVRAQCIQDLTDPDPIYGLFDAAAGEGLSSLSRPDPSHTNDFVYIAADSIVLTMHAIDEAEPLLAPHTPAQAQAYVDAQAVLLVKALLDCFWSNQPTEVMCGAGPETTAEEAEGTLIYGGKTSSGATISIMPDGTTPGAWVPEEIVTVGLPEEIPLGDPTFYDSPANTLPMERRYYTRDVKAETKIDNPLLHKVVERYVTELTFWKDGAWKTILDPAADNHDGDIVSWVALHDAYEIGTSAASISAGQFTSRQSLDEANRLALLAGLGALECLATNDPQLGRCGNEDVINRSDLIETGRLRIIELQPQLDNLNALIASLPPDTTDPHTGQPIKTPLKKKLEKMRDVVAAAIKAWAQPLGRGPFVAITAAGTIFSTVGRNDANAQAQLMAQSMSDCNFGNDVREAEVGGTDADVSGGCCGGLVGPSTMLAPLRSQANAQAELMASALVDCTGGSGGADSTPFFEVCSLNATVKIADATHPTAGIAIHSLVTEEEAATVLASCQVGLYLTLVSPANDQKKQVKAVMLTVSDAGADAYTGYGETQVESPTEVATGESWDPDGMGYHAYLVPPPGWAIYTGDQGVPAGCGDSLYWEIYPLYPMVLYVTMNGALKKVCFNAISKPFNPPP